MAALDFAAIDHQYRVSDRGKKTRKQEELVAYFYFIICHDVSSFNSKSSN